MEFARQSCKSLFLAPNTGDNAGALAFVLGADVADRISVPSSIGLKSALTEKRLAGSFIYCPDPLDFDGSKSKQQKLVDALHAFLEEVREARGMFWLPTAATPIKLPGREDNALPFVSISADGTYNTEAFFYELIPGLTFEFYPQAILSVTPDQNNIRIDQGAVTLGGRLGPNMRSVSSALISCSGPDRGAFVFRAPFDPTALQQQWQWGFQWVTDCPTAADGALVQKFGFYDSQIRESLWVQATLDILDPLNLYPTHNVSSPHRCAFYIDPLKNKDVGPTLKSFFRTTYGALVTLTAMPQSDKYHDVDPAGLVLTPTFDGAGQDHPFIASPIGDFVVCAPAHANETHARVLCGLGGTEFVTVPAPETMSVETNARLRFIPHQPAYAPVFPLPQSSPVGPPAHKGPALEDKYQTSYVEVLPPPVSVGSAGSAENGYVAQPHGSALYGYENDIWQETGSLLGTVSPSYGLPEMHGPVFPMFPYSGKRGQSGVSQADVALFEQSIVAPTRREAVALETNHQAQEYVAPFNEAASGLTTLTTPSGVIATLASAEEAGSWKKALLAQIKTPAHTELAFVDPSAELIQAFQTNQLFMVAANDSNLSAAGTEFLNTLNIEDWQIEADVGNSPGFGDYANILIIKGIKGPLYDPAGPEKDNLIANPQKWTQKDDFSAPTTAHEASPDKAQLVNLSSWLQDYFKEAVTHPDGDYLENFNKIAADPNWTGVLMLRAKIASPPEQLAGIVAGVRDPSKFYAHHLAIRINQIEAGSGNTAISIKKQSSVYGLIYYEDSEFVTPQKGASAQPVVPSASRTYDFILLSLKVLFENTAIKKFSSYTQLSMNTLFGSSVDRAEPVPPAGQSLPSGSQFNSLIMSASYQNNNGHPSYKMATTEPYVFTLHNNILQSVEFSSAQMNTVTNGSTSGDESDEGPLIRFGLEGFLQFAVLEVSDDTRDVTNQKIDLFSYGPEQGSAQARQGLSFSNLALDMTFSNSDPYESQRIVWDNAQMGINSSSSTTRDGSLIATMPLDVQGFMDSESAGGSLSDLGYLGVATNASLQSISDKWNGLNFEVSLGTAGDLASKLDLTSHVMLAWSPNSEGDTYQASVGIQMPGTSHGASLISLQNVLSLSYGPIQLLYADKPSGKGAGCGDGKEVQGLPVPSAEATDDGTGKQFIFVLNEIAIKFFGLAKIPPSGATAFYLFSDADASKSNSGLAWYAVYNNEPEQS